MTPTPLWRVFPWNPDALEGERFSAAFAPSGQGRGRFDLPANPAGVVYLAESEVHAVAESIQKFRNGTDPLSPADLVRWGHRLALVEATPDGSLWPRIPDLCDAGILAGFGLGADQVAYRDRRRTQRIAQDLHSMDHAGLRWWSAFWGEWHTVVLFNDRRSAGALTYGAPMPLDLDDAAVREAARLLDIS